MLSFLLRSVATLIITIAIAVQAQADVSRRQCIADAASARKEAVDAAKEAYDQALAGCRGPCFESCVTTQRECAAPARETRESCQNNAQTTFNAAIAACRESVGCGQGVGCFANRDFQSCLVDPRVARRQAIAGCNSAYRNTLKTAGCKNGFNSCARGCRRGGGSSSSSSSGNSSSSSSSSSSNSSSSSSSSSSSDDSGSSSSSS
jgi:hypothetical protein